MGIKIENNKNKTSLCIDGELTIYTAQEYRQSILAGFTTNKDLELDLAEVEEIDTSGLQILAAMNKEMTEYGNEMKIIAASNVVIDAIQASHLMTTSIVDLKSDEEGDQS